ncbi:Venom allergen 5 [Gryllus bimaculatus]|nr:Venom allergen 5 [Gryllus bimaculatus]
MGARLVLLPALLPLLRLATLAGAAAAGDCDVPPQLAKWDDELANRAQRWADRRVFQHNPCKSSKKYPLVGENLAMQLSFGKPPELFGWEKAVSDWYNEVEDWSKSLVNKYRFSASTGHYTQLVWANTTKVGCGFCSFTDGKFTSHLFVCNYAPGGNVVGTPVYAEGAPRAACRRGRKNRRYPALCL